jgi:transcription elongation factor GreA
MENETIVTKAGLEKLEAELAELTARRPGMAQRIKEARELGDLKENAEYHAAKDDQGLLESKIRNLEAKVRTARVVEQAEGDTVGIGTRVTVVDVETGSSDQYVVVGAAEADPLASRISYESPIGRALTGARSGDTVTVELPRGSMELRIDSVEPEG